MFKWVTEDSSLAVLSLRNILKGTNGRNAVYRSGLVPQLRGFLPAIGGDGIQSWSEMKSTIQSFDHSRPVPYTQHSLRGNGDPRAPPSIIIIKGHTSLVPHHS